MKNERRIAPAGVRFLVALVALGAICAGCAGMPTGRFDTLVAASKALDGAEKLLAKAAGV